MQINHNFDNNSYDGFSLMLCYPIQLYILMKTKKEPKREAKQLFRTSFYELVSGLNKRAKSSIKIQQQKSTFANSLKPYRSIRQLKTLISQQKFHHYQKTTPFRPSVFMKDDKNEASSTFLQKGELMGIIKLKLNKHRPLCNKKQNLINRNDIKNSGHYRGAKSTINNKCVVFDNSLKKERTDFMVKNSQLPTSSLSRRQAKTGQVFISLTERSNTSISDRYPIRSMTSNGRYDVKQDGNISSSSRVSVKFSNKLAQQKKKLQKLKEISGWQVNSCEEEGFIFQKEEIKKKIKQICK